MTNEEELKRRIELKRQLVLLTVEEIWALEDELWKMGDRVAPENRQPEPASLV